MSTIVVIVSSVALSSVVKALTSTLESVIFSFASAALATFLAYTSFNTPPSFKAISKDLLVSGIYVVTTLASFSATNFPSCKV